MNNIFWLLYAADVVGGISFTLGVIFFGSALFGAIAFITHAASTDLDNTYRGHESKISCPKEGWKVARGFFIASAVAAAVAIPIPSGRTIYAMAAAEMGREALKTQTGDKALVALNAWLDKQIKDAKK